MGCPPAGELERLHGEGTLAGIRDTGTSPCPPVTVFLTLGTLCIWGRVLLCHGAGLCLVGYLALASTHRMPGTPSPLSRDNPECL